jgi:integrase
MPRLPDPFPHRGWWVSDAGGPRTRLVPLSATKAEARQALIRVLAERDRQGVKRPTAATVRELANAFLDHVEANKSRATYLQYRNGLNRLTRFLGHRPARSITRHDAQKFRDRLATAKDPETGKPLAWALADDGAELAGRTKNVALIAAQVMYGWAIEAETFGLVKNPFRLTQEERFPEGGRKRVLTDAEFKRLMGAARGPFKHVLFTLRWMPLRPQDLRNLRWKGGPNVVDLDQGILHFGKDKTSRRRKDKTARIVALPPPVLKLLKRRRLLGDEWCFVNANRGQYTTSGICQTMRRCRERAGLMADENGEEVVLYHNRHTVLSQAATVLTASELQAFAGHTDYRTTQKYVHLAGKAEAAKDLATKAREALRPRGQDSP